MTIKIIRTCLIILTIVLSSGCAMVAPVTLPDGLQVTVIYKERYDKHTETLYQTQIVRGTIHDNVPVDYSFPAMNLLKVEMIDGSSRVVDVSDADWTSAKVGEKITSKPGWKVITRLPDPKYRRTND